MVLIKRKITYRLYPTPRQVSKMHEVLRLHQQLYNAALEQRIWAFKAKQHHVTCFDQNKELTQLRREFPEYSELNAQSMQVTMKRLDLAFKSFFRRVKEGSTKPGFPRFKSVERYPGWGYATHGDGWRLSAGEGMKHGRLRISEIGNVKVRGTARIVGKPKTLEVQFKRDRWYASVTIECEAERKSGTQAIGIDWGLEAFATVADNEGEVSSIANPRVFRKSLKKLKAKQRNLSKKKRGSNRRREARKKVARIHADISNRRKEFLHQTTAQLVRSSGLIATEKLNVMGMCAHGGAHKKGLNREILSAAPGAFLQMLKCKAEEAGIELIEIETRKARPTQTCYGCGAIKKKELAERIHACPCGITCSRDENAARVILNRALFGSATGREPTCCGGEALAFPMKQETPAKASLVA